MIRFQSQRKQKYTVNLNTKRKQHLKGLAHPLGPIVIFSSNGSTEGVLARAGRTSEHHELTKTRITSEDRDTKALIMEAIVRETGACDVQIISRTLVLYRPTKERKISLPRQEYPKVAREACVKRGAFR